MISPEAQRAIEMALQCGRAILKFISPNDCGLTGGHQCGYYLRKSAWQLFTEHPPEKGVNRESHVQVHWQNGQVTDSRVKWYGKGTRSEYRLTRFGRGFPFVQQDRVGDLLVLVPQSLREFSGFVLHREEDIEAIETAFGVEIHDKNGAVFDTAADPAPRTEDDCILQRFTAFVEALREFPPTADFSGTTQQTLEACVKRFQAWSADKRLTTLMDAEYDLFRMAEKHLCQPLINRSFPSIDDFLTVASTILQRRKSRAGWSFENQFEYLLRSAQLPFELRAKLDGVPDVVIPGSDAYRDNAYPTDKLFMVGLKRTCKDRWRQVTKEAQRIPRKHILTLQQGISGNQLAEMQSANVTLIVPKSLHRQYPIPWRPRLLTVEQFLDQVSTTLCA